MTETAKINYADPKFRQACRAAIKTKLNNEQFDNFMTEAEARGLNPLLGHLHPIMRGGTLTIQTGIDAFRHIAHETGECAGQDGPVFEHDGNGKLVSCTITVYRWQPLAKERHAYTSTCYLSEFIATYNGKPSGMWAKMEHTMLAKCTEAVSLRKAFSEKLSKIYTDDEMGQAENDAPVATEEKPAAKANDAPAKATAAPPQNEEQLIQAARQLYKDTGSRLKIGAEGAPTQDELNLCLANMMGAGSIEELDPQSILSKLELLGKMETARAVAEVRKRAAAQRKAKLDATAAGGDKGYAATEDDIAPPAEKAPPAEEAKTEEKPAATLPQPINDINTVALIAKLAKRLGAKTTPIWSYLREQFGKDVKVNNNEEVRVALVAVYEMSDGDLKTFFAGYMEAA